MTERDAGSDPSRIEATAERTDGGFVLNGEKWFVTSGDVATVLVVMANVVDGADRLPTLFVVDATAGGVEIVDDPDFTHSYPDGHPTIRFDDVEVGPEDVIGGVGGGDDLQRSWFTEERLGIAARGVGAMWRLLDETVDWATAREQGGERIYDYQGVSFPLADSAADAAAGRLLDAAGRRARRRRAPTPSSSTTRPRWRSCSSARPPGAAPTAASRPSAAAATCARTSPSDSCASSASTGSGRAPARSSG